MQTCGATSLTKNAHPHQKPMAARVVFPVNFVGYGVCSVPVFLPSHEPAVLVC
jgi:hypothetical protein